jgi:hypothetical protein
MKPFADSQTRMLYLFCLVGFALVVLNGVRLIPTIGDLFLAGDSDDQMRLVEVRDWLGGQGWFDLRQYRVLPPEGISMHWSRYLDAGIAAMLTSLQMVLPQSQAELATLILWPSLLACLMIPLLVFGTARLYGTMAPIGALAVFFGWSKLGGEFVAPRIDHHGVQMLGATALFYLSLVPGRARLLGALGGLVTAFTLAIGLEQLPVLATVWGIVALRHAFGDETRADWLIGFGIAFSLAAPMLMAGQTPASAWGMGYCDALAVPVMSLGAVGVVTTLTPVLFARVLTGPWSRIAAMIIVGGLGLWLAFPLLGQCMAGPYSEVPPEVREIIETKITEAMSAATIVRMFPDILGRVLLPPLVILVMALVALWYMRSRLAPKEWTVVVQSLVVTGIGLAAALVQVRAANLMTPAIPSLAAFVVYAFSQIPRTNHIRIPLVILLLLGMPTSVAHIATSFLTPSAGTTAASGTAGQGTIRKSCRNADAMAEVAGLPKSVLFNQINLGPAILATTDQSVTAAAYHRSPDAFWNGSGAFESEDALRKAVAKSGADLLIICVGGIPDGEAMLVRSTKAKTFPAWLTPEPGQRSYIAAYRIDKAALAAAGSAP